MSKKQRYVTESEKQKMWQLYQELGTFVAVARKMKRDPATVSRHVHAYEAAVRQAGITDRVQEVKTFIEKW